MKMFPNIVLNMSIKKALKVTKMKLKIYQKNKENF